MTNFRPAAAAARTTSLIDPVPSERLVWMWKTPRTPGVSPAGGAGNWRAPAGIMTKSAIAAMTRTATRRIRRNTVRGSRPRMKTVVDRSHPLLKHVRVDLRRREIGVAEHHLDGPEIGAAVEQVGRKGMAQHVRAERPGHLCAPAIRLQDLPEPDARQAEAAASSVDEQPRAGALAEQRRPAIAKIAAHPRRRLVPQRHDTLLF